jgi:hypothetical protein
MSQGGVNPWQNPVPPILYKYLSSERLDIFAKCRIRFTQRKFFEDDHELQPDYDAFGTADQIKRYLEAINHASPIPRQLLASLIATNPKHQQTALQTAIRNNASIHNMGVLCLTVSNASELMWKEYGREGTGFVIGFDTTHPGFKAMTHPRGVGRVIYSAEGFPSFLGMLENNPYEPLFRKRPQYSYEQEWRSLRLLKDLESHANDLFLATVDPKSILEVAIRPTCAVDQQIREIVAHDGRYSHVRIAR